MTTKLTARCFRRDGANWWTGSSSLRYVTWDSLYQNQRFPHCLFHETGWKTVDWGRNKLISTDGLHPPGFVYTNTSQWGSCHAVSGLLPDAFFQFFFSLQWPASDKIKMSTHYNTIYLLKICVISMYFSAHRRLYPPHPTTQQPVLVGHSTGTTCTSTYRYSKHLVLYVY